MTSGISLVLASGGARGLCFIGALKALEEAGIKINSVYGTSMGAIVGAAWCSEPDAKAVERAFSNIPKRMIPLRPSAGPGLASGSRLHGFVKSVVQAKSFEELKVPLEVWCTDINSGQPVSFSQGLLIPPTVASATISGIFSPVRFSKRNLVDGGYTVPIPAPVNADACLIIDPSVPPQWPFNFRNNKSLQNLISLNKPWQLGLKSVDITNYRYTRLLLQQWDYPVIAPDLGNMKFSDASNINFAIEAGYKATRDRMPDIEALVA